MPDARRYQTMRADVFDSARGPGAYDIAFEWRKPKAAGLDKPRGARGASRATSRHDEKPWRAQPAHSQHSHSQHSHSQQSQSQSQLQQSTEELEHEIRAVRSLPNFGI
jgi:hypothetical protein